MITDVQLFLELHHLCEKVEIISIWDDSGPFHILADNLRYFHLDDILERFSLLLKQRLRRYADSL